MKNYKLAIVGATGVVGRMMLKVLEEERLPISEYKLFASKNSAGTKIKFMGSEYTVNELTEHSFDEGFDFALFSAGATTSKKFSPIAASNGCIVIDNSSAFRMDSEVPLVVPEVNPYDISKNNGIIANPNCSTIQAVVPLKVLDDKYSIKRIVYSTYQAVSGAGKNGILDLENGIENYKKNNNFVGHFEKQNSNDYTLRKFEYPIFNNCLPHIDVFLDNGYTKEEEKMINETRKILGKPNLNITATCVRVPVFNSHSESINIEFENSFDINEVVSLLDNTPGIILMDNPKENIFPLAQDSTSHNEVFVGRIRRDYSISNGLNLWVVADNIRKGAATNSIQILEKILETNK